MIDFTKIQQVQQEFVSWLESRPGMVNIKNKYGVTRAQALCLLSELLEVENEVKTTHKWWDKSPVNTQKILEELTDLLSHIANVANELDIKLILEEDIRQTNSLESQFLSISSDIIQLPYSTNKVFTRHKILTIFRKYMQLVYSLKFNVEQLEEEYYKKLEKNYSRFK